MKQTYHNRATIHNTALRAIRCAMVLLCMVAASSNAWAQTLITRLNQITDANGNYKLAADITNAGEYNILNGDTFRGTLDGDFHTISGRTRPLFSTVENATICNVMLSDVHIQRNNYVGAIARTAQGNSRIYNCGILDSTSTIGSNNNYAGSLVGFLDGSARVLNCFSYATITGGTTVGGIVGYNNVANVHAGNLQTLVMNCMFYGNITGGTTAYPIYGGNKISNTIWQQRVGWQDVDRIGINNYNYFRKEARIVHLATSYNCALAAEERFLRRWEFYRGILNSNRELVAYYISWNLQDTNRVAKWVQVDGYPYPILKRWGRYPSQINSPYVMDFNARPAVTYDNSINYNIDYNNPAAVQTLNDKLATHYCGAQIGTIRVRVERGDYGSGNTQTITLPITDMDTNTRNNRYDYCFRKVQLPYYNDLFEGNYAYNWPNTKVVSGWEITEVRGNNNNTFGTANYNAPNYNFADTTDAGKDRYSVSGRIFAEGGYYYVPQGVTQITIRAHWANAALLSDSHYDKIYSANYANNGTNFEVAGGRPTWVNGTVYNNVGDAINALPDANSVYDNVILLVGNYHLFSGENGYLKANNNRPFTIMSIDNDRDNEPDYCFYYQTTNRVDINPVRFNFLWQPGIGIAAKVDGDSKMPDVGILFPGGHFEITETAIAHYTEFEYDFTNKQNNTPLILNNGVFEQFVSTLNSNPNHTSYMILGGHTWMKVFCNGTHGNGWNATPHRPISVIGGEYDKFYLTGTFNPGADVTAGDDAECYINGGKFGELAGAGQEQVNGNVTFLINHAIIRDFYGGGINKQKAVTGNINVTINNSIVDKYCGGPKFGDMAANKTVTTNATGTTFGVFYGAGNGGTSIYRHRTWDTSGLTGDDADELTNHLDDYTRGQYDEDRGIATGYEYEYFVYAGDGTGQKVGRFYVHYASFDVAQTKNVTSTLDRCLVLTNYYGGGNLGAVDGTATSTLNNTIVKGNAYGGGFSASIPSADVYSKPPVSIPRFDAQTALFYDAVLPAPVPHVWSNSGNNSNQTLLNEGGENRIHTDANLGNLGNANTTNITVTGNSRIYGSLFGGGAMSDVLQNTTVNVTGNAKVDVNVYGGGNEGKVGGKTNVNIGNAN